MLSSSKSPLKSLFTLSKAFYSGKLGPMQKVIMLCGAPGVGKGMYSRMLAQEFGYAKVSTGDEIRKILNGSSGLTLDRSTTNKLKQYVDSGRLVPDEIILEILYQKIKDPRCSQGVILDGFPRTVNQLNTFTQVFPIHLAVNITNSFDYLMASIISRRTCMDCGMSYSAFSYYKDGYELDVQMPQKEGVCDHCHGPVRIREDDREEIVRSRLEEYNSKTYPLLKKLDERGLLVSFEAKRGERDYPQLQQMIVSKVGLACYYHQVNNREKNMTTYYN